MNIIILGAGEVGFYTALRLSGEKHNVVVVDLNAERLHEVSEQMDVRVLQGAGSSPKVLKEAGIEQCDLLMAVTDSDEVNLQACFFSRLLSPGTTRLARVRSEDYLQFINEIGLETVSLHSIINPEFEVAQQIANLIKVPAASSVADFAGGKVKLLGLKPPPTSKLLGKPMAELHAPGLPPFLVAAIERGGTMVIPRGDDKLHMDDLAYVVAREDSMDAIFRHFGIRNDPVKNVIMIGGGAITQRLIVMCHAHTPDIRITIVDQDPERCMVLANEYKTNLVLCGDGADINLLEEENLGDSDLFCAVTDNEEDNVLIALLGKKRGARRIVARVASAGYIPLAASLGVDMVVSPRSAAAGAILRFLRRGKVLSVSPMYDYHAEMVELVAQETSSIVGQPLKDLKIPRGILLAAVVHQGEVIIPDGNTIINPGDELVFFIMGDMVKKLEKLISVKLEFF